MSTIKDVKKYISFIYCVFTPRLPSFSEQYLLSSSQPSSLSSSSVQTLKLIVRDSEAASALNETVNWVLTTFPSFDCPHNMSSLIHFLLFQTFTRIRRAQRCKKGFCFVSRLFCCLVHISEFESENEKCCVRIHLSSLEWWDCNWQLDWAENNTETWKPGPVH